MYYTQEEREDDYSYEETLPNFFHTTKFDKRIVRVRAIHPQLLTMNAIPRPLSRRMELRGLLDTGRRAHGTKRTATQMPDELFIHALSRKHGHTS